MGKKIILFCIFLIALTVSVGYLWFHSLTIKTLITRKGSDVKVDNTIPKRLADKLPVDILLLGYGGGNHDGPYLTDSMMVVHIDPKAQKIFLVSIPRDVWVQMPTKSGNNIHRKINSAYAIGLDDAGYPDKPIQYTGADGGGRFAEYEASQVTGLSIDYFVGMDFTGFTHTIDSLGGVDVNVDTTFDDYAYPKEDITDTSCGHSADDIKAFTATVSAEPQLWDYFPCRYMHLHFDAGVTRMDGKTALEYVRSRHSAQDGTDFGRAKRQRNLLLAVKQRVLSAGFISQAIPFMTSLGDDFRTDLNINDIKALVQNSSALSKYEIVTLALTDQNYLIDTFSDDGQSILAPKAGIDNWTEIKSWIAGEFSGKPVPVPAVVLVENGTHTSGLAQKATDKLKQDHVQTLVPKTTSTIGLATTRVIVYDKNISAVDADALRKEFNVSGFSYETATTSGYNVLVIIGDDYVPKTTPASISQ